MKIIILCLMGFWGLFIISGCSQQITLFNGQNLDGWKTVSENPEINSSDVWSIRNGILHCEGKPTGYIRTTNEYSNYKLHLEWRWTDKPSNSGVLLHTTGDDKIWPLCVEAQLMHENAGDIIPIQKGSAITVNGQRHFPPADKFYKIVPKQYKSSENPIGQWNSYDILCENDSIQLTVNGVMQNTATQSSLTAGAICLQSEGAPIEFRNITLTLLK